MIINRHNKLDKNILNEEISNKQNIYVSNENMNVFIYNSDNNKLFNVIDKINNKDKLLVINSKNKNCDEVIENIENKINSSLF